MFKAVINQLKTALILLVSFTIITGLIYPIAVTGIVQLLFPKQANGSLIEQNGKTVGSLLIGQSFTSPNYFWGRPSATSPYPYNGENSSGSNMGSSNTDFLATVKNRIAHLHEFDTQANHLVPVDLVTASGSGLDPEISPLAAFYQVPRIAKLRHLSEKDIQELIQSLIQKRTLGILGEPRINVLQLNLALDNLRNDDARKTPKS
ncbi:MAG: potassium-transporting ATPase subunit KdpC [Gammaproteobacteria bacterium]|nr:potassium-transporting ATPase subunit KdpC [Gammaproteobacteria bacterium]